MRLYLAGGTYVGTQADARKLDRNFQTTDVPTDKEGLMNFLNSPANVIRPVETDHLNEEQSPKTFEHEHNTQALSLDKPTGEVCPNCKRTNTDARRIAALTEDQAVRLELEQHIQNAPMPTVIGLLDASIDRVLELKREATS